MTVLKVKGMLYLRIQDNLVNCLGDLRAACMSQLQRSWIQFQLEVHKSKTYKIIVTASLPSKCYLDNRVTNGWLRNIIIGLEWGDT